MKKTGGTILIIVGIFELIFGVFVLPEMNRNFAAAGVQQARDAGFAWVPVALGAVLVLGGVALRGSKDGGGA
jgi:hypothetical protein